MRPGNRIACSQMCHNCKTPCKSTRSSHVFTDCSASQQVTACSFLVAQKASSKKASRLACWLCGLEPCKHAGSCSIPGWTFLLHSLNYKDNSLPSKAVKTDIASAAPDTRGPRKSTNIKKQHVPREGGALHATCGLIRNAESAPQAMSIPQEGPSSQYLRTLVPKTIPLMVLGPGSLDIGYLDPLGIS